MTAPGMLGLVSRRAGTTREEFIDSWLNSHAPLAIPWGLANGCISYIQIHNPRPSAWAQIPGNCPADLDISSYDGAIDIEFKTPPEGSVDSVKSKDFSRNVILPDEKKILGCPASENMRLVDKRLIDGERIVLVEDGKVRIGEDGMPVVVMDKTWEMWSVRGEGDGDKGK